MQLKISSQNLQIRDFYLQMILRPVMIALKELMSLTYQKKGMRLLRDAKSNLISRLITLRHILPKNLEKS